MKNEQKSVFKDYCSYLRSQGYSKRTVKNREIRLKRFNDFMIKNNLTFNQIGIIQLENYAEYLKEINLSKSTINDYIARVRELFNMYLVKNDLADRNPFDERRERRLEKHHPEKIRKILSAFEDYLILKNSKPRGIESKSAVIRDYLYYAEANDIDIYAIGIREAEGYREYLRLLCKPDGTARYKPKTINAVISHLEGFYFYLNTKNMVYHNPFKNVERMREAFSLPKNILKINEMKKLLENIEVKTKGDFEFKVLVELLYSTGARINEIASLKKADVDLKSGYIAIYDDKERQDRKAVLTDYAKDLLSLYMEYLCDDAGVKYIFRHGKKRSLNAWVNRWLKKLCTKLKLPLISCHSIRHTIASHLFKKGADIREVQEYLGHRIIKNTEIYTHIMPEDLKKVIDKTHPREQGV